MIRAKGRSRRFHEGKALPALVVVQALVAVVALGAMGFVALQIKPLLEEKARLETDIGRLEEQVSDYRQQIDTLQHELEETQTELDLARQQLAETFNMSRYEHPLDPVDTKVISSRYPRPAAALRLMDQLRRQGVGWYLGGRTPEQGFDSPGFAAYVLAELDAIDVAVQPGEDLLTTSRRLFERLPPIDEPGIGDLAFYPAGYVLFYFVDENDQPFVIGMTPAGITSLKPDFAKPVGYRRSGLGN